MTGFKHVQSIETACGQGADLLPLAEDGGRWWRWKRSFGLVLAMLLGGGALAAGELHRTQSLTLQEGWNAIYLEVQPDDRDPAAVFANLPVDIVASYFEPNQPTQFVTDPSADIFREAGWGVWYAPDRPDAFLTTLFAIYGSRAYLVHAQSAANWALEGAVVLEPVRWRPDSFNLVGFGVDRLAPPTFAQFFAGSDAQRTDRIYRLKNGKWTRVSDPAAETMRSGEAFWIYCEGSSEYQGPLSVATQLRQGLVPSERQDTLKLRNHTDHPVTPTLAHVPTGNEPVPLSLVIRTTDETQQGGIASMLRYVSAPQPTGAWTLSLPPIEAGEGMGIPMEARLEEMSAYFHSSLLKITTDLGTEQWIPVSALRPDLKPE